jgi:hypothetical protein
MQVAIEFVSVLRMAEQVRSTSPVICGEEVFAPLKDLEVFRRFRVDVELNTIAWETGADLASEYLYEKVSEVSAPPRT